ncbi:MAG: hypothetical protein ACE5I5_04215 [Candidatus Heimdallarchaeota archaeon]
MPDMKTQVCLTPAEQKRLIGKAIASMDEIKRAYKEGIIGFPLCTTNAYIIQELTGRDVKPENYACGLVIPQGTCFTNPTNQEPELVIVKGEIKELDFPEENLLDYVEVMNVDDVIIKSGNAMDCEGNAAVFIGEFNGGEIGKILPWIVSKGIRFIVPMTFDKLIPVPIKRAVQECGILKMSNSMGIAASLLPLPGTIITPIEAVKILTGAVAIPVGAGGVGGAEGSIVMLIAGSDKQVQDAWKIIDSVKGEPPIPAHPFNCIECGQLPPPKPPHLRTFAPFVCNWRGKKPEELPHYASNNFKRS